MTRDDHGSITLWMLGLSLLLMVFGGLALDLWRGLAVQRELASVADSAAIAAASGIDEERYRLTGELALDAARSRSLALTSIEFQDAEVDEAVVDVARDGSAVTVRVLGHLELGLFGVLIDDSDPVVIRSTATAAPRLVP